MERKRYKMFKFLSVLEVDLSDDFSYKSIYHLSSLNAELLHYSPDATSCPTSPIYSHLIQLIARRVWEARGVDRY